MVGRTGAYKPFGNALYARQEGKREERAARATPFLEAANFITNSIAANSGRR
jgi:hypothetical protein